MVNGCVHMAIVHMVVFHTPVTGRQMVQEANGLLFCLVKTWLEQYRESYLAIRLDYNQAVFFYGFLFSLYWLQLVHPST